MDPLTAVITIAGGIQTVFTFASALKTYIDTARGAREDLKKLVGTLESVFRSIEELQGLLDQNKVTGYWNDYGVARAQKCVQDGYFIVGKLGHVLLKSGSTLDENVAENINSNIFIPFVWPIYRSQVQELNTELILLKLDIGTAHTTYRSQTWTAEEKVKGTALLKQYQHSREIFMSQLQALKEERCDKDEENYDVDDDDDDTGSRSLKLGKEERRIFDEWEEAVAERIRLERRLKEEEAAAEKRKEQQIRDDFVKELETAAADRQMELSIKRQEMQKLIEGQDIPPKDKERIIENAIQTFHPVTQDSELVQALIDRSDPPKAKLPSEFKLGIRDSINKPANAADTKRRTWSWRRLRSASSNQSKYFDFEVPVLLRDPAAPGGRAVLYAAHFTPDPYGQYRGIEIEALSLWAKCAKITNTSSELTAEFMYLPENCKSAILRLLEELCSASKDYTWNMLLVYQAQSKGRKKVFGSGGQTSEKDSAGIFAIFKRHLRQHHGINSTATQASEMNGAPVKLKDSTSVYQDTLQEKPPPDGLENDLRQKTLQDADKDDPIPESSQQATRGRTVRHNQHLPMQVTEDVKAAQDNSRVPMITLIESDGMPVYRVPLRGMSHRDFSLFRSLSCLPDPDDPGYLLILANVPQKAIQDAIQEIYEANFLGPRSEMKDFPKFQFVPSQDNVLNEKAALLQQRKKEDTIRKRMMNRRRSDYHYDDYSLPPSPPPMPPYNSSRWDRANTNIYDVDGHRRPPIIPEPIYLDSRAPDARGSGHFNKRDRYFDSDNLYDDPQDIYEDVKRRSDPRREERVVIEERRNPRPRDSYREEVYYDKDDERHNKDVYHPSYSTRRPYAIVDYGYPREREYAAPPIPIHNDLFAEPRQSYDDRYPITRGRTIQKAGRASNHMPDFGQFPPPPEVTLHRERDRRPGRRYRSRSRSASREDYREKYSTLPTNVISEQVREREELLRRLQEDDERLKKARQLEMEKRAQEELEKLEKARQIEMEKRAREEFEKLKRDEEIAKRKATEELLKRKTVEIVEVKKPRFRRGKTRIPKKFVHFRAIVEMGYPFEEEENVYIILVALSKEQIDQLINTSATYLQHKGAPADDADSDDYETGPQGARTAEVLIEQWTSKSSKPVRDSTTEAKPADADARKPTAPSTILDASVPSSQQLEIRSRSRTEPARPRVASDGSETVAGADGPTELAHSSSLGSGPEKKAQKPNGVATVDEATERLAQLQEKLRHATEAGDHVKAADLQYYAIPDAQNRLDALKAAKSEADPVVEVRRNSDTESESVSVRSGVGDGNASEDENVVEVTEEISEDGSDLDIYE